MLLIAPPPVCQLAATMLPITTWTVAPAGSAMPFVRPALLLATQLVLPVPLANTLSMEWQTSVFQPVLITLPISSWMVMSASNAMQSALHAVVLMLITAIPASRSKYSTLPPNLPSIAPLPVGLVSSLMALTVAVSSITH